MVRTGLQVRWNACLNQKKKFVGDGIIFVVVANMMPLKILVNLQLLVRYINTQTKGGQIIDAMRRL
jgi:hypothetical protein